MHSLYHVTWHIFCLFLEILLKHLTHDDDFVPRGFSPVASRIDCQHNHNWQPVETGYQSLRNAQVRRTSAAEQAFACGRRTYLQSVYVHRLSAVWLEVRRAETDVRDEWCPLYCSLSVLAISIWDLCLNGHCHLQIEPVLWRVLSTLCWWWDGCSAELYNTKTWTKCNLWGTVSFYLNKFMEQFHGGQHEYHLCGL